MTLARAPQPLRNSCRGYSLVEMMVALAVGSICIAALYAGYTIFSGYYTKLTALAATDRSAVQVLDVLTRDLRMAGHKDFNTAFGPIAGTGVRAVDFTGARPPPAPGSSICGCNAGEVCRITVVYDVASSQRVGLSYYTRNHPGDRGARCRLWRRTDQWNGSTWSVGWEDVVADWVDNLHFVASDNQVAGRTYAGLPQIITISLQLRAPQATSPAGAPISRIYNAVVRVRNVSLVL